jgi:hypothetical protein
MAFTCCCCIPVSSAPQSVGQQLSPIDVSSSSQQPALAAAGAAAGTIAGGPAAGGAAAGGAGLLLCPDVAITNSFGMPSMDRQYLLKDIPAAAAALGPGQVLPAVH